MTPNYEITAGDTLPPIEATEFTDADGNPVSLVADDDVVLRIQRSGSRDDAEEIPCTVTQLSPAKATSPAMSHLTPGRYVARFVVQFSDGEQLSWPNGADAIYIRVHSQPTPPAASPS